MSYSVINVGMFVFDKGRWGSGSEGIWSVVVSVGFPRECLVATNVAMETIVLIAAANPCAAVTAAVAITTTVSVGVAVIAGISITVAVIVLLYCR